MMTIDPAIRNPQLRAAVSGHAAERGILPGEYAISTQSGKMRYRNADGQEVHESLNKILAADNMRKAKGEGKASFAAATLNPGL